MTPLSDLEKRVRFILLTLRRRHVSLDKLNINDANRNKRKCFKERGRSLSVDPLKARRVGPGYIIPIIGCIGCTAKQCPNVGAYVVYPREKLVHNTLPNILVVNKPNKLFYADVTPQIIAPNRIRTNPNWEVVNQVFENTTAGTITINNTGTEP